MSNKFPLPQGVCRTVCRPRRTEPRGWDANGAARVVRYAIKRDGLALVSDRVLTEMGYKDELCQVLAIIVTLKDVQDRFALLGAINGFLNVLAGASRILKAASRVFRIIGALLVAIGVLQIGLVALRSVLEELDLIPSLRDLQMLVCGVEEEEITDGN